jgi:YtxH-like protein
MRLRKENILWNVLLGTGVYLIDSLRGRLADGFDEISDRARDTYGEASRRVSRASDVIRGEDHRGMNTAVALLLGVGVGVGVGLLLAPASGEETRNNISNKVQEFGDRMRDKFNEERRGPESASYGT